MLQVWDGLSKDRLIEMGNSIPEERSTAHLTITYKINKMKIKNIIPLVFASMLMLVMSFTTSNSFAQSKTKSAMMKDCCMMMDGKMMVMKNGKTMPMEKDMTMKNGTKCMTTGECIMKDGKKMTMKEGDCMQMSGKMCSDKMKMQMMKKDKMAKNYSCPMHREVTSNKPGKCSKCGMDLKKSKKEQMKMEVMKMYSCPMHAEVASDKPGKCSKCGMELAKKN